MLPLVDKPIIQYGVEEGWRPEALGLGHAVFMARELVGNEPFAVLLADDVVDAQVPCLKQMMEVFNETKCSVMRRAEIS
jgi:UTP-glucose-1-phosphate uridylyltransferase